MKRTIMAMVAAAAVMSAGAQELRFISFGEGTPGLDEPGTMGMGISPDGRYICGALQMGLGYFMGDLKENKFFYEVSSDDEGAQLLHVDNNGLAIGFDGPGVTVSIDGTRTELEVPTKSYKYVLGNDLTTDGNIKVGSLVGSGYMTSAAYCIGDDKWKLLPEPDAALQGVYAKHGTSAQYISGDGRVIAGYIGSYGPATLWIRDAEGKYQVEPLFARYAMTTTEDTDKKYAGFFIKGLSDNGKYVLIAGNTVEHPERTIPLVYDTEEKILTEYDEEQENFDDGGYGITPTAICNNGMFVGVVGQIAINLGTFIMRPGATQAETLAEAYPQYREQFENMDIFGYHVPYDLSADGQYLIGSAYYSEDPYNDENPYFTTYILTTGEGSGVESISAERAEGSQTTGIIYGLDGQLRGGMRSGVNIIVSGEGTATKVLKK